MKGRFAWRFTDVNDKKPKKNTAFQKGVSGNPAGRPPGSRNKSTLALEQMLEGEGEQLIRKAIELAKQGHFPALRLCIERLLPARKERTVQLELRPIQNARDLPAAFQDILSAVTQGMITPGEGESLANILNIQVQALELIDHDRRLQALESYKQEVVSYRKKLDTFIQNSQGGRWES